MNPGIPQVHGHRKHDDGARGTTASHRLIPALVVDGGQPFSDFFAMYRIAWVFPPSYGQKMARSQPQCLCA